MAINTSRLATTLGLIVKNLNTRNASQGSELTAAATALRTQVELAGVDVGNSVTSYAAGYSASGTSWVTSLGAQASAAIISEVIADRNLADASLGACMAELKRQMIADGKNFKYYHATLGAVTDVGSPTEPVFITTDLDEADAGASSNFVIPDTYVIKVLTPTSLSIQGLAALAKSDANWPGGSGVNTTLSLIDPGVSGGLVTNGNFETWVDAATPGTWSIQASSANVSRNTTVESNGGTYSCKIAGSATTARLRQTISVTSGSVIAFYMRVYQSAVSGDAGSVYLRICDSSGNTLGTGASKAMNTITTATWTTVSGFLYITDAIAAGGYLELQYSGAAGDDIIIDNIYVAACTALYTGGPRILAFRAPTVLVVGDSWTWAITGGTVNNSLIVGLDRLIGLTGYTRLPTASSASAGYEDSLTGFPTIASASPVAGAITAGDAVVLTGTGFTGATSVLFGASAAQFKVDSDTQITCTALAAAASPGVRVVTRLGTSASDVLIYT